MWLCDQNDVEPLPETRWLYDWSWELHVPKLGQVSGIASQRGNTT